MAFTPEPGKGRLFDNKIDRTKDSQPDWTGTIMTPRGEYVHVSGWFYPPSERSRVATISIKAEDYYERKDRIAASKARKAQDVAAEQGQPPAPEPGSQDDSDIPF